MNKPIKPDITIPQSFAENGVKTDFDDTLLADGFDNLRPDVLAGDNLNKFIDDTYQGLNYGMAAADAINLINEGETLTVVDGKLTSGASGGGLEIGDIGIAPLGIDETQGKRRYLNGQIIIQEQYVQFTNKVKSAIVLYPTLACTEEEWQATALLTVGGQVGKFVVDDDAGTIRLPRIIMPIQGLTDLSKLAEVVEAGLPNITAQADGVVSATAGTGALRYTLYDYIVAITSVGSSKTSSVTFDASRSSAIYGNSDTVQQEQIQYPYFIQVATGVETKDEIINTIELNNPYSFGDSKYSQIILNNISWLRSLGQWNPKIDYTDYYDWILTNANNGEELFKLSTEEYDDYCWVVNTAEETFRLPIKVKLASGKAVVGNGMTLGLTNGNNNYGLIGGIGTNNSNLGTGALGATLGSGPATQVRPLNSSGATVNGVSLGVTTDPTKSGIELSDNDLFLYFYVGETVQNANLINAGRIEEKLTDKVDVNSSWGFPSNRYIDLTLNASGSTYTAPANGWFYVNKGATGIDQYITFAHNSKGYDDTFRATANTPLYVKSKVTKGEIIEISYNLGGSTGRFRFIYAQGEV